MAYLPPVKWKVQHLSCSGYPTLFPEGKISDVIDLTDALTEQHDNYKGNWKTLDGRQVVHDVTVAYNAIYNCIYHTPTQLTYKQLGMSAKKSARVPTNTACRSGKNRKDNNKSL